MRVVPLVRGRLLVGYDGSDAKVRLRDGEGGAMLQDDPNESTGPKAEGRRLSGGAIASLTGVGLLLVFMVQNTESVQLDFLVWSFTCPLWLLTLAAAVLGALVWFGLGVMRRHRRRVERRQERRG